MPGVTQNKHAPVRHLQNDDSYGIGGKTLKWIAAFLCFRQQRVVVNGVKSDWAPVLSGVPQGTVLGPLLFSLYINDISSDIESEIRLFADDCVCYREIKDEKDSMNKKIVGRVDFSDQFRKITVRYKRIGYNINIMRQSACLVFNPITVNNFASLFNCTPVGRESDSMMAPNIKLFILVGLGRSFFVCCLAHRGSTVGFLLLQCSSGVVRHPRDLQVSVATHFCRVLIFASS